MPQRTEYDFPAWGLKRTCLPSAAQRRRNESGRWRHHGPAPQLTGVQGFVRLSDLIEREQIDLAADHPGLGQCQHVLRVGHRRTLESEDLAVARQCAVPRLVQSATGRAD